MSPALSVESFLNCGLSGRGVRLGLNVVGIGLGLWLGLNCTGMGLGVSYLRLRVARCVDSRLLGSGEYFHKPRFWITKTIFVGSVFSLLPVYDSVEAGEKCPSSPSTPVCWL